MIDSSGSGAQDIGLPDPVSPPQMRLFSEQCSQIQIQIQKCTNTQEVGACQQHSHRSVLIEGRTQVQKYRSSLFHLPPVVSPIRAQGRLGKIWRASPSCDCAAPSPPLPALLQPLHPFQLLANFARNRLETQLHTTSTEKQIWPISLPTVPIASFFGSSNAISLGFSTRASFKQSSFRLAIESIDL